MADYTDGNRRHWNKTSAAYQRQHAPTLRRAEPCWGAWAVPEAELAVLGEVGGRDVLEVGCGSGFWAAHLARRGARVTALDLSASQLEFARATVREAGLAERVTLVEGDVEALPFPAESFDLVFSDHGAITFAEPARSLAEVARVLRPGGRLAFNITTPILEVCWDARAGRVAERLVGDYFGMRSFRSDDETSFQLPYGAWIRLFVRLGFVVEDLVEIQPPYGASTTYREFASAEWARRWPAEMIWKVRRA